MLTRILKEFIQGLLLVFVLEFRHEFLLGFLQVFLQGYLEICSEILLGISSEVLSGILEFSGVLPKILWERKFFLKLHLGFFSFSLQNFKLGFPEEIPPEINRKNLPRYLGFLPGFFF